MNSRRVIKVINKEVAGEIIDTRKPRGIFYFEENKVFIGIDNTTGDAFVEEFNSEESCIDWLLGKEFDEEVPNNEKQEYTSQLNYDETMGIISKFHESCLQFWEREKEVQSHMYERDLDIRKYALVDIGRLSTNPYSPKGKKLDKDAIKDFVYNRRVADMATMFVEEIDYYFGLDENIELHELTRSIENKVHDNLYDFRSTQRIGNSQMKIKPSFQGRYYVFEREELENMMIQFVENKTGFSLKLTLGSHENPIDTYVQWEDDEVVIDAFNEFEESQGESYTRLSLHPAEIFMNIDHILTAMFNNSTSCESEDEETYYVYISE